MMRKLSLLLLLLMAAIIAAPATAQQPGSIVDVVAAEGGFTTFVAALSATGLDTTLRSPGPYTVFAPTDDAFAVFMAQLGETPQTFLANPERLRGLLQYHIVDGLAPATLSPITLVTETGSNITVSTSNNTVVLNGSVSIVRNLTASNGVIHAVDAVLLPTTETLVPAPPAADSGAAYLRIAHFSADMPAVDVFIDGSRSEIALLQYGDVSNWTALPAGSYDFSFVPQGALVDASLFGPLPVNLVPGTWTTVAAIGSQNASSLRLALIDQDVAAPLAPGNARLTLFNSIDDVPAVDLVVGDNVVMMNDIGYTEYAVLDVPAGSYDFKVAPTGIANLPLVSLPGVQLAPGDFYLMGAAGTLEMANVALEPVSASEIAVLLGTRPVDTVAAQVDAGSLFEVASTESQLSIFVTASQASGLENVLRSAGPITVFAPTDVAFASLPEGTMDLLMQRPAALSNLLLYHMVQGHLAAADLVTQPSADTILGIPMTFELRDASPLVNGSASFVTTDLAANNGVLHIIDHVLLPPLS